MKLIFNQWKNWNKIKKILKNQIDFVFYSEGENYLSYLLPLIYELSNKHGKKILYLTSSPKDPFLLESSELIKSFYIGSGTIRTLIFSTIQAKIIVMTMPDLNMFYIKKTAYVKHYVYVPHSIVSTHMIYRERAFDFFDTIFCVGNHHINEIKKREKKYKLKTKNLVKFGYPKLDSLIENKKNNFNKDKVLIAPSWGENGLLEKTGGDFIKDLLVNKFIVVLRPHPQTKKLKPSLIKRIKNKFSKYENFQLEEDISSSQSFFESFLMISDYSGAALEFAFSQKKPVLFVDLPKKINNKNYQLLDIEPLEVSIRGKIGKLIQEKDLMNISHFVIDLKKQYFDKNTHNEIDKNVFNIGKSASKGAEALINISNKL